MTADETPAMTLEEIAICAIERLPPARQRRLVEGLARICLPAEPTPGQRAAHSLGLAIRDWQKQ